MRSYHHEVDIARAALIRRALEKFAGNVTLAAEHLGLHRTYLARLCRQFGIRAAHYRPVKP